MEYILIGVIIMVAISYVLVKARKPTLADKETKPEYSYTRKQYIMTKSENDFYHVLQDAIGTSYMVYPQAHLDLFLDHKVKGQTWSAALSKIQRKSVDFLICSREYYSPLVAIELDDISHTQDARMARDEFVDGICKNAGMPIVHILCNGKYDQDGLLRQLAPYLK